jgi:hypothetical protein
MIETTRCKTKKLRSRTVRLQSYEHRLALPENKTPRLFRQTFGAHARRPD